MSVSARMGTGLLTSLSALLLLCVSIVIILECYSKDGPLIGIGVEIWILLFSLHTGLQLVIGLFLGLYYPIKEQPYESELIRIWIAYVAVGSVLFTLFIMVPVVSSTLDLSRMREYFVIYFVWSLPAYSIYGVLLKNLLHQDIPSSSSLTKHR